MIGIAILLALQTGSQEPAAPPETVVLYAKYEGQGQSFSCTLQREDPAGKDLGTVPLKDGDLILRLRPTPTGTALAGGMTGVLEIDRSGKVIWEFRPVKPWDHLGEARRLANGNTLITAPVFHPGSSPPTRIFER